VTTTSSIRQSLTETLTTAFQVTEADLATERSLTDLGLDSLAIVELIDLMALALGRPLADDTLHPAMTLDAAVTALESVGTP
jgi:acyl carrier protein